MFICSPCGLIGLEEEIELDFYLGRVHELSRPGMFAWEFSRVFFGDEKLACDADADFSVRGRNTRRRGMLQTHPVAE